MCIRDRGIGEPLLNLSALIPFIHRLSDPKGLNISMRRITVSTCGLPDMMLELANAALPINVAVSLHAPNQKLREQLMPIAKQVDLETLFDACRQLITKTGRRITFEYALFDKVNDRDEDAMELADRLHGMLCHAVSYTHLLFNIGIILYLGALLFFLVTLPVEFNASKRAIASLDSSGMLSTEELKLSLIHI